MRPVPPDAKPYSHLKLGDRLDLRYGGGWWEVSVTSIKAAGGVIVTYELGGASHMLSKDGMQAGAARPVWYWGKAGDWTTWHQRVRGVGAGRWPGAGRGSRGGGRGGARQAVPFSLKGPLRQGVEAAVPEHCKGRLAWSVPSACKAKKLSSPGGRLAARSGEVFDSPRKTPEAPPLQHQQLLLSPGASPTAGPPCRQLAKGHAPAVPSVARPAHPRTNTSSPPPRGALAPGGRLGSAALRHTAPTGRAASAPSSHPGVHGTADATGAVGAGRPCVTVLLPGIMRPVDMPARVLGPSGPLPFIVPPAGSPGARALRSPHAGADVLPEMHPQNLGSGYPWAIPFEPTPFRKRSAAENDGGDGSGSALTAGNKRQDAGSRHAAGQPRAASGLCDEDAVFLMEAAQDVTPAGSSAPPWGGSGCPTTPGDGKPSPRSAVPLSPALWSPRGATRALSGPGYTSVVDSWPLLVAAAAAHAAARGGSPGTHGAGRLPPGARASCALDSVLARRLELCSDPPVLACAPLRTRGGTPPALNRMAAFLRAAYARPLCNRNGKSDSRGLTLLGVNGNRTKELVSAIATHSHPKGDCRTLGLLAPHQCSYGLGADADADAGAPLLAAAAVRAHYSQGGKMQALEVLLAATSQAADADSAAACSTAGEASPLTAATQRGEAARRLMLAWVLELAVSVDVAQRLGEDGLASWHEAHGGLTSCPAGVTAPPAHSGALPPPPASAQGPQGQEDSDVLYSDVLVLVHAPRLEKGWWRANGFVEPRELPHGTMRSFAMQLAARNGGTSRLECFTPDARFAPLLLAAAAKPGFDYLGTAISAWREAAGMSTMP